MPPPRPGSRWYSSLGHTGVVEVASDKRFTKTVRYYSLNNPQQRQHQGLLTSRLDDFEASYQQQPRYPVEWINEGSVWRRLDDPHPIAVNCVVVTAINDSGYVIRRPITTEGLGEPYGTGDGVWMGGLTVFNFMRNYARVWGAIQPDLPDDSDTLYPEVLYRCQLMTRSGVDPALAEALGSIADEEPPKPKRKRKRKRKKPEPVRRSAWARLLDED
jgi:hypothetical protein